MIQGSRSVEERLAEVVELVRTLTRRVDDLTARLGALEAGEPASKPGAAAPEAAPAGAAPAMMSWMGQSRVLQRIAVVSFALVVALVLRTLTDSQLIGVGVGVVLGVAYSVLLVVLGIWLLGRGGRGQRVLPACGAVLLCLVALEAHRKFQLVSAATVNWILIADLLLVGATGIAFRMGSIVSIAVLVPTTSALTVGFPNLQFPLAAALFLLANLVAYLASRAGRLQWLLWTTFAITLSFWLLWSVKVRAHLLHPESQPAAGLGTSWFLPCLAAFALLFALTAVRRAIAAPRAPGAFHAFLPAGNVLWAHSAAVAVIAPPVGGLGALGAVALGAVAAHLAVAAWLWRRLRERATGITAFTLAGALLLALGLPDLGAGLLLEVTVLTVVALGLLRFATLCGSPGLRLCALLLQVGVCVLALADEMYAVPPESPVANLAAALVVVAVNACQYRFDRSHPPRADNWFQRVDPGNNASILLLWTAAVHAFGFLRLLLDRFLVLLDTGSADAFQCGQSVILNCASIGMLLWGVRAHDRQILLTAALVVVIGGLKVFGSDLLTASGLPLVLAVFSFGMAAAVGSIVLGRMQRAATPANGGPGA